MADDTQPNRGLVLLGEWHVSLRAASATTLEEADELYTQVDGSLFGWCGDLLESLPAGIEVEIGH
jgi:hypothetical protein